jgi:predicted kinase
VHCVLLIGIPASGKSSFFKARFVDSHVRINRDMLGTSYRYSQLLGTCVKAGISFVSDNTNVARRERKDTIEPAREMGFKVVGYYFESNVAKCVESNSLRPESERVPKVAIYDKRSALEYPNFSEGFDELYFVKMVNAGFGVSVWEEGGESG